MTQNAPRSVVVLGSTGSVGTQALDVVRGMPGRLRVVGLSGRSRWRELTRQAKEFRPEAVALGDETSLAAVSSALNGVGCELLHGPKSLERMAAWPGADVVLSAVSGGVGLPAAVAALEAGKTLALANKEALVMAGPLLMELAERAGGAILPVDSEHSALHQLLRGRAPAEVDRIVLTASGGPFYGRSRAELEQVSPEEALRHPTWRMGHKISVDSATLMNKALEVVEARWLFGLPADRIGVLIHPQSVIHCIVELVDGSALAHMGAPDMRLPIQYALAHPDRLPGVGRRLELGRIGSLELHEPDPEAFPALRLGYRAAEQGGTSGAVMSAANEAAVHAFLDGRIRFTQIVPTVEAVMDRLGVRENPTLDEVAAAAAEAKKEVELCLGSR